VQQLSACPAALEVSNEIYRLERAQRKQHYSPELAELTRIRDELASQLAGAIAREDEALVALYSSTDTTPRRLAHLQSALEEADRAFDELVLTLYLRRFSHSDRVSLVVFSEDQDTLLHLAEGYFTLAQGMNARVGVWQFYPPRSIGEAASGTFISDRRLLLTGSDAFSRRPTVLVRSWDSDKRALKAEPMMVPTMKSVIGIGLDIAGRAAFPRFSAEAGLHVFQTPKQTTRALVSAGDGPMTEYVPPEGIERRGTIGNQPRRRHYRLEQGMIDDDRLGARNATDKSLTEVLASCIEEALTQSAREVMTP
jgi:hypothetical protein